MPYRAPDAERMNELTEQANELEAVTNEARGRRRRAAVIAGGVVASWLAVVLLAASQGSPQTAPTLHCHRVTRVYVDATHLPADTWTRCIER
ncbi:hypothetical protein AKJ09_01927 [Labilithrix luteola]|uniref:Uncharacterized protein n=1 Tax=Labilithrix luteola TaxID=1391654 RepID=A0A0K1PP17_9BACT|nr:hypothetical protein [Labilithrix luteola]AKU95263.1 hypothetical protein AKJ09_01927 [Labilithrix luteola]